VGETDHTGLGFPDGIYRYDTTTGTMMLLPGPGHAALAVSDDGTVVLGDMIDPGTGSEVAAIWTEASGWTSLGYLPNALSGPRSSIVPAPMS
jgi:hypothetical protein